MIRLLSIFILSASVIIAADSSDPPKAIQPIINKLNNNIIKQYKDYQKQQKTLIDTAIKELNSKAESLAKAGNLDDAIAVKKIIESLKADDYANTAVAQAEKNADELLNGKDDRAELIGQWKVFYMSGGLLTTIQINKDWTVMDLHGIPGKIGNDLVIMWSNNTSWKFIKENGKWAMTAGNTPFTLIKDRK